MNLEPLWYWMTERHAIYERRSCGLPKPWTEDPILQKYRFCNVYRELDRVTVWIRENWRDPYANHPNLWFAMCVARQINSINTLRRLGFPVASKRHYVDHVRDTLEEMYRNRERIYGAAYIITAGGRAGKKYLYTANKVLSPIAALAPDFARRGAGPTALQDIHSQLSQYIGFGPFISYEVASDLRWTRYFDGSDHLSWANPGPGAKRGLGRLYYGDRKAKISKDEMLEMMQELLRLAPAATGLKNLEMREIEHSLCEVDKYLRTKQNQGTPKQRYQGT